MLGSLTLAMLICPLESHAAPNYTEAGSSKTEPYGIRSPEYASGDLNTGTRHHRLGEQSGIGSSTARTTGTTAETMPSYNYRPTSVSPALGPTLSTSTQSSLQPIGIFSQSGIGGTFSGKLLSPALGESRSSSLNLLGVGNQGILGSPALRRPPPLGTSDLNLPLSGPRQSRGATFTRELINPL